MKGTNSIKIETPFEGDDKVYYINGGRTSGKVNKLVDDMIKLINDLQQENQQLKIEISAREKEYRKLANNWNNKLKAFIVNEIPEEEFINNKYYVSILDKMQELEQGSDSK